MSRAARCAWITVTLLMVGVAALIFLPPFVPPGLRQSVMDVFAPLCHQMPDRSFAIGGIPLAVGHRCTGIYLGLAAGALMMPRLLPWKDTLRSNSPWILGALLILMTVDWVAPSAGAWINTPISRVIVGLLFGWGAGYFAGEGLTQLLEPVFRRAVGDRSTSQQSQIKRSV